MYCYQRYVRHISYSSVLLLLNKVSQSNERSETINNVKKGKKIVLYFSNYYMTFIQKEKSVFVTTEEPLKTGIGFYGPHLIRLLHGSQKQTVYHGSQVTSHHSQTTSQL